MISSRYSRSYFSDSNALSRTAFCSGFVRGCGHDAVRGVDMRGEPGGPERATVVGDQGDRDDLAVSGSVRYSTSCPCGRRLGEVIDRLDPGDVRLRDDIGGVQIPV